MSDFLPPRPSFSSATIVTHF